MCGDKSAGLYGYVALGPAPSGTIGSSGSSPSDDASVPASTADTSDQAVSSRLSMKLICLEVVGPLSQ